MYVWAYVATVYVHTRSGIATPGLARALVRQLEFLAQVKEILTETM